MPKKIKAIKVKPNLDTFSVKIKVPKSFVLRVNVGVAIVKLGVWIIGGKTKVETHE